MASTIILTFWHILGQFRFTGIFQSYICQLIQLYLASWFIASYQFVPGMVAVLEQKIKTN